MASRLKTNLTILVPGDAAGKLVNFFAFGRLARVLEPEAYGHFEFVLASDRSIGTLLIEAGLGPWGARAVARGPAAGGPGPRAASSRCGR